MQRQSRALRGLSKACWTGLSGRSHVDKHLFFAGIDGASVGGVSGGISVIADIPLAETLTFNTSLTPRVVQVASPLDSDDLTVTFDLSFALGVGWATARAIGLYLEGWGQSHDEETAATVLIQRGDKGQVGLCDWAADAQCETQHVNKHLVDGRIRRETASFINSA